MSLDAIIQGEIRRVAGSFANERRIRLTNQESLAMAQFESSGVEGTRAGTRFLLGNSAAITGIAPGSALPTTAAQWGIFNNEPSAGGKTYFFEELGVYLTSGTPAAGGILLACIYQTPTLIAGNKAGISISPAGKIAGATGSSQLSNAGCNSGRTLIVPANPNWFVVAQSASPNVTAFPGSTAIENRNLQGKIAVPPQYSLGLAVVGAAGTSP